MMHEEGIPYTSVEYTNLGLDELIKEAESSDNKLAIEIWNRLNHYLYYQIQEIDEQT